MEWYQIQDLLLGTTMALVILIPVVGLTVRFTLAPLIDKFARLRAAHQSEGLAHELAELRGVVAGLRQEIGELETELHRLAEFREFDRELRAVAEPDRR